MRLEPHEKAGSNPARRHQFVLIPVLLQHVERLLPKRPNVAIGSIAGIGDFRNRSCLSHIAERNRATPLAELLCDGDFQVDYQSLSVQPLSIWIQESIPSDKTVLNCRPFNDEDAKFMSAI